MPVQVESEITSLVINNVIHPVELASIVPVNLLGLAASYSGNDTPGTGDNILADGFMRLWKRISDGSVFTVSRMGTAYYIVEMGIDET